VAHYVDAWRIGLVTAKTSAMLGWLFAGSSIFSASFALLGGQEIINQWLLGAPYADQHKTKRLSD
jgi:TRAP-type mannitol/chloroaromatic compound transport system permease large subunit